MPVSIARASLKRSRRMREHSIARRREHLRTDGGDTVAKEDGVSEEEVDTMLRYPPDATGRRHLCLRGETRSGRQQSPPPRPLRRRRGYRLL